MRKRVVIFAIVSVLFTASVSHAVLPALYWSLVGYVAAWSATNPQLVDAMINSVVVHVAAASLIYAYNDEQKKKANVDGNTNIKKPMEVVVVPPPTADNKVPIKKAEVQGKINYEDMQAILNQYPSRYPSLQVAFKKNLEPELMKADTPYNVGDWVTFGGGAGGFIAWKTWNPGALSKALNPDKVWGIAEPGGIVGVRMSADENTWAGHWNYGISSGTPPPPVPRTRAETRQQLLDPATSNLPDDVYSDRYGQDIDDFIKDNPNVVHFEDEAGNAATAAEIAHATDYEIQRALAFQAQQAAVDAAQTAATNAQQRASAARNAANANPGDPGLEAAARSAEAAAELAAAALARALADQAAAIATFPPPTEEDVEPPSLPGDNTYDSAVDEPEKKDISGLLTTWFNSSPLAGMIRSFTISTDAPVKSVSAGTYYGREIVFDFERYESLLSACGGVLLVICHGVTVLVIFRGW